MESEKTLYTEQTDDVTLELARLVAAGWNERQIARLARLRATYSHTSDEVSVEVAAPLNPDSDKLTFMRWLYNSGRIES